MKIISSLRELDGKTLRFNILFLLLGGGGKISIKIILKSFISELIIETIEIVKTIFPKLNGNTTNVRIYMINFEAFPVSVRD